MSARITHGVLYGGAEMWEVRCCVAYADSDIVPEAGVAGSTLHDTEEEAVRACAAHLEDEHGIPVVRTLCVLDVMSCNRCGGSSSRCSFCDGTGQVLVPRHVDVGVLLTVEVEGAL